MTTPPLMPEENLFLEATRKKWRFHSEQGLLTVEQLWDLDLTTTNSNKASLDGVARKVNRDLKELGDESFVNTKKNPQEVTLAKKLELVKQIIIIKQADNAAKVRAAENRREAERLKEILANKKDEQLNALDTKEIERRIAELTADSE